jgi:hypothetical protein
MGLENKLTQAEISAFERGIRQPPLYVLLEYARAAAGTMRDGKSTGDYLEILVDDALSLSGKLPKRLEHLPASDT